MTRAAHDMMQELAVRPKMMIEGISRDRLKHELELAGIAYADGVAKVIHRLANTPAPEVDPDSEERAEAKRLWMQKYPSISGRDEDAWQIGIAAARAVAAAKKVV